jgi:voltage-gated potassium channel Kch
MRRFTRLSPKERVRAFWEEDRGLSVLLVFIAILSFVIAPLAESSRGGGTLLRACVTLMFAYGAFVLSTRRRARLLIGLLTAVPISLSWLEAYRPGPSWSAAAAAAACLFALMLSLLIVRRVFRAGPITIHRVVGSIVVYMMLGIAFGEAARFIAILDPQAYSSANFARIDRPELYYFSLVTLTTVGYGDITPLHPMARSLAVFEALTGQLFPAILIARLVSQELMSRPSRPD